MNNVKFEDVSLFCITCGNKFNFYKKETDTLTHYEKTNNINSYESGQDIHCPKCENDKLKFD